MSAVEEETAAAVLEFCGRVIGDGALAAEAANAALSSGLTGRVAVLGRAARECRRRADGGTAVVREAVAHESPASASLAEAVAGELAAASRVLPERQREVLVLRELLGLSYDQIGHVMGIEPVAVGSLVARARLLLREELRGDPLEAGECSERERAVRILARRQDVEEVESSDEEWIREHMAECRECERAHAAMLEASVCYRAWRPA